MGRVGLHFGGWWRDIWRGGKCSWASRGLAWEGGDIQGFWVLVGEIFQREYWFSLGG